MAKYISGLKLGGGGWFPTFYLDDSPEQSTVPVGGGGGGGEAGLSPAHGQSIGNVSMPVDVGHAALPGLSAIGLVAPIASELLWNAWGLNFDQNSSDTLWFDFWQSGPYAGDSVSSRHDSSAHLHADGPEGTLDAYQGADGSGFSSFYWGPDYNGDSGNLQDFKWTVEVLTKHLPGGDEHIVAVDTEADTLRFNDFNNNSNAQGGSHGTIDTTAYLSIQGPLGDLTLTASGHEVVDNNHFGGLNWWDSSTTDTMSSQAHVEAHGNVAALLGEAGLPLDMGMGLGVIPAPAIIAAQADWHALG